MRFDLKSEGKFCRSLANLANMLNVVAIGSIVFLSLACQLATKPRQSPVEAPAHLQKVKDDLNPEVSLSGDQKSIEQLRQNIPAEKKADNDLLKETLGMMGEVKYPPQKHRDKFNKQMREIRNDRRKSDRKLRDDFRKKERKDREAFQKAHRQRREKFNKLKMDRDQRREFYNEQDEIQKDFFAGQRDARKEFDADMRTKTSDFNAYLKERQDEFDAEYRVYSKKYSDYQKPRTQRLRTEE